MTISGQIRKTKNYPFIYYHIIYSATFLQNVLQRFKILFNDIIIILIILLKLVCYVF